MDRKSKLAKSDSTAGSNPHAFGAQRLFLNKKPLCLQYNLPSSRRHFAHRGGKRRDPSFILTLVLGLGKLLAWAAETVKKEISDFFLKPAEELFPEERLCDGLHPAFQVYTLIPSTSCHPASSGSSTGTATPPPRKRATRQTLSRRFAQRRMMQECF